MANLGQFLLRLLNWISLLCWKICSKLTILVDLQLQLRQSSHTSRSIDKTPEKAGFPKRHGGGRKRKKVVTHNFDEPVVLETKNTGDTLTNSCPLDEQTQGSFEKKKMKSEKLKQEKNANASQKPSMPSYCSYGWETNTPSTVETLPKETNTPSTEQTQPKETNTPSTEENQPEVKNLSLEDERKAISIANCLFFVLNEHVSPAINRYFFKQNLLAPTGNDFAESIYKLISEKNNNMDFLSKISSGDLYEAVQGRNCICHLNIEKIYSNWEQILCCWAIVCDAVDEPESSNSIREVRNRMNQQSFKALVGARSLRLAIPDYNEGNAFALTEILFASMLKILAPSIRRFLTSTTTDFQCPSLDVFQNLKEILRLSRAGGNLLNNGEFPTDVENTLKVSIEARNSVCHGRYFKILRDWQIYFVSWLALLDAIKDYEAKKKLKKVLDKLIESKNKGFSIKPTRFI